MTEDQLYELPFIPKMVGRPFYPGGIPMNLDQMSYGDKTYRQIYFDRVDAVVEKKVKPDKTGDKILKNYILYYIHAPIFQSDFTDELINTDFSKMTLDQMIMKCMEFGLDPL